MRKPQRLLIRIVVLALAAAGAASAHAAIRMNLAVHTVNQARPGAAMPPGGASRSEVVLGDSHISERSGNTTTVYDFARRRRYVLDETTKSYDEYSLYDVVGFRELELRNRAGLRTAMAAAQLQDKLSSELDDVHALSVGSAGAPLSRHADGDEEVFASGEVTLLSHGKQATPVGAADAARFVQFLRYRFAGHPALLDALREEGRIPARLRYQFHPAWGDSSVTLDIEAVRDIGAAPAFTLDGYTPRAPVAADDASLDALLERAWASRATLAAGARLPYGEALAAQLRESRPLDAYLLMMESQLSGARLPAVSDQQKQAFQADPALRSLAQALAASDPAGLRQAVGTLVALRAQAASRRYLLQLFEANDRLQLGDAAAARGLYAEVLRGNPAIAGAYKDIGDFYFRNFDTPRAWRSWEIARTLAPMFGNLEPVAQFERTLAARFPAYF